MFVKVSRETPRYLLDVNTQVRTFKLTSHNEDITCSIANLVNEIVDVCKLPGRGFCSFRTRCNGRRGRHCEVVVRWCDCRRKKEEGGEREGGGKMRVHRIFGQCRHGRMVAVLKFPHPRTEPEPTRANRSYKKR